MRTRCAHLCHAFRISRAKTDGVETFTFLLSAGEDESLNMRFEPIGPAYEIRLGDHLRISVSSPTDDPIEVTSGSNWVTIWPAPTAKIRAMNASGTQLHFLM
jgi:hypothetical protein